MGLLDRFFGPPSKEKFAKLFIQGIQRAGEKRKLVYDPQQSCVTVVDASGRRMYLDNIYPEYSSTPPAAQAETMRRFVRSWFDSEKSMPDEYGDASHDLLPAIRSRAYFAAFSLMTRIEGKQASDIPYQILGEDMAISLVYDFRDAMRSIGDGDLKRWSVSLYEALEVARDNLQQLPSRFVGPQQGPGVYLSVTNDNYDAARLLLLDTIRQFQVRGEYVAMVPNRDTLIVTGSKDVEGVKGMAALAKDALQKPRPMSGLALRLERDEWLPWMPERSHPSYPDYRMLQVQTYGQNYAEQKHLLDKLHESTKEDIFVAGFSAVTATGSGEVFTYCVWSKGCHAWLPRTDRVVFFEENREPVAADWVCAVAGLGELMRPLDMFPERYEVFEYPSDEQLKAIGCVSMKS